MKKLCILSTTLLLIATSAMAQTYRAPRGGKDISDMLIGTFFEDISYAADGGLNAQLVQNGSFEYNLSEHAGWGAGTAWRAILLGHSTGYVTQMNQDPINDNNSNYMRVTVERVGHFRDFDGRTGYGLANEGFDGVVLKEGDKYDFSAFFRTPDGKAKEMKIVLVSGRDILGEATFTVSGGWKKYQATLTSSATVDNAMLQILSLTEGQFDVDAVSLLPRDTYKGHGMRKDLAEAIAAMRPKFVRFPGGCVIHGGEAGFWDTYRWKKTIGPKEERQQIKNTWGYHQSREIGYYEYFQFCEDIGATALPILPVGVSCQGAGGSWQLPGFAQMAVPMDQMDEWVDDALDLIEWANGDANTEWGRLRAEQGHPEPFNLKYLGLGNEEFITPEFIERFNYIYDRVTAAHPEITIVGTAGINSHPENKQDYVTAWAHAEEKGIPILDEHYYEQKDFFLTHRQYDSYPRDRKTKVYLGEYAAKDNTLMDALAEALYLCHVERNGDVVVMTSYAPLLCNVNHSNWLPTLIMLTNSKTVLTINYYVQKMFGISSGTKYYGNCVKIENADMLQEQSVVLNPEKRELYVKMINGSADVKKAAMDLSIFKIKKGTVASITTIKGKPEDKNDMKAQPVVPQTEPITLSPKMSFDLEPYSFSMITIKL